MFELVEQTLARLPVITPTKRKELYADGMYLAARGSHWRLVYQLVDLVGLEQCKQFGTNILVLDQAINCGDVEVYSYLSKKLDCVPCAVSSGSVDMLAAVLADGHATLEQVRDWAHLSPNMAMFDALGVPPNGLDLCFVRSVTAELARALRARGAKVPADYHENALLNQCNKWWYYEIVVARYLAALPDRAGVLESMARKVAAGGGSCYISRHRILANLVRLGAAPRSLRCVCPR